MNVRFVLMLWCLFLLTLIRPKEEKWIYSRGPLVQDPRFLSKLLVRYKNRYGGQNQHNA